MFSQDDGTVTRFIFLSNGKSLRSKSPESLVIPGFSAGAPSHCSWPMFDRTGQIVAAN
jgi:hypothetical protein